MTRPDIVVTKRQGLVFVCFVAVLGLALVAIFNSPVDPAIKNQREVIHLLTRARPEPTSAISFQIERVTLADRITLIPERKQIAVGYALTLHVRSSTFTIEAQPLQPAKTGIYSFFRDDTGLIRFEPDLGRPASAESRPWSQPTLE